MENKYGKKHNTFYTLGWIVLLHESADNRCTEPAETLADAFLTHESHESIYLERM